MMTHAPFDVDACILDLDGTLVDTLDDFVAALAAMNAELGLRILRRGEVEPLVGKGSEHLIRSVLRQVAGDTGADALYGSAWDSYQLHYRRINGLHSALYPGVAQGLGLLRAHGLPLACLTNKPTAFARELLALKGIDGCFVQVFGGDAFARRKPDPLPVLETCAHLGSAPGRTLLIGDSSNDAQAARAAGCPVVLLTHGYNHGEPVRQVDADAWLDRLDQVAPLLRPSSASLS